MKMKSILLIMTGLITGVVITLYSTNGNLIAREGNVSLVQPTDDMEGWSKASKMAAKMMMKKYGEPDEKTKSMMIWKDKGPWKKTVIFAKEYKHDFPMPHTDVMQQFIEYKVPADKYDELAQFDGSVVCNRTNGEISARCDKEEANFLALNLANDIVTGKKDVKSARDFYAQSVKEMINGGKPAYMQGLQFDAKNMNAADLDQRSPIITDEDLKKAKQMMEMKEKEMDDMGMDNRKEME